MEKEVFVKRVESLFLEAMVPSEDPSQARVEKTSNNLLTDTFCFWFLLCS